MRTSLFFVAFISIACLEQGRAQTAPDDSTTLPSGPLIVSQMPKFAQWTIDYTYSDASKPHDPTAIRPIHRLITQTGLIIHEEITYEQNLSGEKWSNHDIEVERRPGSSVLVAVVRADTADTIFPGFDWISRSNFSGKDTSNGHKCLIFKAQVDSLRISHPELAGSGVPVSAVAYIDADTHYPVSLQFGVETRQYAYLAAPTAQLVIPADFVAAAKAMMDRIQQATPHLAPP